jgi:ribosome maturation protein SDO1
MAETIARVKKEGKHFEILVDLDEALKIRKGDGDLARAVSTDAIFYNLKAGEHASSEDLEKAFGTTDPTEVAEKIIKEGEVVRTADSMKGEQDKKYKQVVDFLRSNAVSPEGRPYTPDRIMKALHEARVNVKNKPIEEQISEIMDSLSKILPIKIEMKKLKITIPAQYTGKSYGIVNEFKEKEEWLGNGDLIVVLNVPAGLEIDFYDKLNNVTHGSILSEELKS